MMMMMSENKKKKNSEGVNDDDDDDDTSAASAPPLWQQLQQQHQQQQQQQQQQNVSLLQIPDYEDDLEDIVSCFPSLRRKTMQALYPDSEDQQQLQQQQLQQPQRPQPQQLPKHIRDKSPKGSIDQPIQALVDLINAHPSFSTLSSCSGRIALFDPNHHPYPTTTATMTTTATTTKNNASGKGHGGAWLLTSHEEITPAMLLQCLDHQTGNDKDNDNNNTDFQMDEQPKQKQSQPQQQQQQQPQVEDGDVQLQSSISTPPPPPPAADDDTCCCLVFKHEPMILHVAASTWARGQQLLQLALQLGFRESGIVPRSSSSSSSSSNRSSNNSNSSFIKFDPYDDNDHHHHDHHSSSLSWMSLSSSSSGPTTNNTTTTTTKTPVAAVLQKITVMIRSNSLALTVPLERQGPLRPSDAYIIALVQQANDKLRRNWIKLQQLYQAISQTLFQTIVVIVSQDQQQQDQYRNTEAAASLSKTTSTISPQVMATAAVVTITTIGEEQGGTIATKKTEQLQQPQDESSSTISTKKLTATMQMTTTKTTATRSSSHQIPLDAATTTTTTTTPKKATTRTTEQPPLPALRSSPPLSCRLQFQALPDLNLWGHAAVVIPVWSDTSGTAKNSSSNNDNYNNDNNNNNKEQKHVPDDNHNDHDDHDGSSQETLTIANLPDTVTPLSMMRNNNDDVDDDVDILAIGGYGKGPNIVMVPTRAHHHHHHQRRYSAAAAAAAGVAAASSGGSSSGGGGGGWMTILSSKTKCQRSDQVYCLQRRNGIWNDHWMRLAPASVPNVTTSATKISTTANKAVAAAGGGDGGGEEVPDKPNNNNGNDNNKNNNNNTALVDDDTVSMLYGRIPVRRVAFTPRESIDGCLLPLATAFQSLTMGNNCHQNNINNNNNNIDQKAVIAIWGGRASPCQPLNDLLLYEHTVSSASISINCSNEGEGVIHNNNKNNPSCGVNATPSNNSSTIMTRTINWISPLQVQGQGPSPRWGHSMTALSGKFQGRLAVVVGGRNQDHACMDSVHILCLVVTDAVVVDEASTIQDTTMVHFKWETVDLSIPVPSRFFHSTVAAVMGMGQTNNNADDDQETLFVFGGKSDPNNLFESFSDSFSDFHAIATSSSTVDPARDGNVHNRSPSETIKNNQQQSLRRQQRKQQSNMSPPCLTSIHLATGVVHRCEQILPLHYDHHPQYKLIMKGSSLIHNGSSKLPELGSAAAAVQVRHPTSGQEEKLVLVVGGTSSTDTDPFLCYRTVSHQNIQETARDVSNAGGGAHDHRRHHSNAYALQPCPVILEQTDDDGVDGSDKLEASVLVHHRCVVLPKPKGSISHGEMLLLGGGVSSFAFGPCFSRCWYVNVSLVNSQPHEQQHQHHQTGQPILKPTTSMRESTRPVQLITHLASLTADGDGGNSSIRKSGLAKTIPKTQRTQVVFVLKENAKSLKSALEGASLYDTNFRMTKATNHHHHSNTIPAPAAPNDHSLDSSSSQPSQPSPQLIIKTQPPALTQQQQPQLIAVPVTMECLHLLQQQQQQGREAPVMTNTLSKYSNGTESSSRMMMTVLDWQQWVVGIGQQKVPYRTSHYARGGSTTSKFTTSKKKR